jgi:hypothetical protein
MSERQPEPPMKWKRSDDDEPDVEGHRFHAPDRFVGDGVTPESDEAPEDGEGRYK